MNKKVVVLVGGMGAVGQATAQAFAVAGYQVVLLHRTTTEITLTEVATVLPQDTCFMYCDVKDARAVRATIAEIFVKFGSIDVCIYAAADAMVRKKIIDTNDDEFRGQFEANVFGAFTVFNAVAAHMCQKRSGVLIGITSAVLEAGGGSARMGAYSAAKQALRGLLRELHAELATQGVAVYAVAPSLMQTKLTSDLPDKYFEFARERAKLTTLMQPRDVAVTILNVCSGAVAPGHSVLVATGAVSPL